MSDGLVAHNRLLAAGFSDGQARVFLRLLADAEAGRFDRRAAHEQLLSANYSMAQAAVLIGDLLQMLQQLERRGTAGRAS